LRLAEKHSIAGIFTVFKYRRLGSNIGHGLFVGWVEHPDIFCWVSFLNPTYLPTIFVLPAKPNKMAEDRTIPNIGLFLWSADRPDMAGMTFDIIVTGGAGFHVHNPHHSGMRIKGRRRPIETRREIRKHMAVG